MAKVGKRPERESGPSIAHLLLAALLAIVVGSLLGDAGGVPYSVGGGLIWLVVLLVTFVLGILHYAIYVLPIRGSEGWWQGLRLLARHYLEGSQTPQLPRRRRRGRAEISIKGDEDSLPASFEILRAGILPSRHVVALFRNDGYSRSAGPGFVRLESGERVGALFDLRPHVWQHPIRATTRDGIPVETTVSVTIHVRQVEPEADYSLRPFPYDRDAVFQVTYAQSIDTGDQVRPVTRQVCRHAASLATAEIGRYALYELYPDDGDEPEPPDPANIPPPTSERLRAAVQDKVSEEFQRYGVKIMSLRLGPLQLPEEVEAQRLANWQANWDRIIRLERAAADADALDLTRWPRARARAVVIKEFIESVDDLYRAFGGRLADVISLLMVEALGSGHIAETIPKDVSNKLIMELINYSASNARGLSAGETEEE